MKFKLILRVVVKMLLPFILIYALYVQFHGDFGPGGGFQAGVIAAATIILYGLIFDLRAAQQLAPPAIVEAMVPLGVLIFAGTGVAGQLLGGNFLDYFVLLPDPVQGQKWGIFVVELGVFVTVAGTMVAIFYAFAGRPRRKATDE